MTDNPLRRSRTQSLPSVHDQEPIKRSQSPLHTSCKVEEEAEEENFEADDETSTKSISRRPSTVAKEEIAQARRLSEKLSNTNDTSHSNVIKSNDTRTTKESSSNNRSNSLFGTIYSMGGSFWNFIRGKSKQLRTLL